ncbi:hypothetical protein [Bacteroides oleiciplenus]|uniref:hypothetical protein n=1 Tax=Bacteroides oleiciplenus TaxID=626931 RepID=UPI00142F429A|nr:hypothetical protein [Bacteroides oleiciplenus]
MNSSRKKRVVVAWVLILSLMPFFVVKAFHHHEGEHSVSCSHADHPRHSSDDCAICQFSLSLFTEAQSVDFHCVLTLLSFEQVVYQDKTVYVLSYSHYLRGPPTA